MSPLRKKFINEMKLRNFSTKTIFAYTGALVALTAHYHKSPDKISEDEIKQYLLFMTETRNLTYSTCSVAVSAFKLFYNDLLGQGDIILKIPPPEKRRNVFPQFCMAWQDTCFVFAEKLRFKLCDN